MSEKEEEESFDTDDEDDYDDYYNGDDVDMRDESEKMKGICDMEDACAETLDKSQVEQLLSENVEKLAVSASITPSFAKILLQTYKWDIDKVLKLMHETGEGLLENCGIKLTSTKKAKKSNICGVCYSQGDQLHSLCCMHGFCIACWRLYFETKLSEGVSSRILCMETHCPVVVPPEFILKTFSKQSLRAKYERFVFRDYVNSHPELRFCVGVDCQMVIRCTETKPRRASCKKCGSSFCVLCGTDYHAPASCEMMRKWLLKCADDSETANYISAHTKDCPQCHACIEKNGGCNHMQCAKCKHHFCWMCFGDWKSHGAEYYVCSRYKENPFIAAEASNVKARRALEKYLHYFERYENHNKSLKMEEELSEKIKIKIDTKVNDHEGTWIDWQYLHNAVSLLTKCRYTLQYTYPFAYYLEKSPRKDLFEYQQGMLEKEVEELAWAVERAGSSDRGALIAQMHKAEHKRITLLQDFFFQPSASITSTEAKPGPSTPRSPTSF